MAEPGMPTAAEEALGCRIVLQRLHADDEMGYAALDDVLAGLIEEEPGAKQRVVNVIQFLADNVANLATMKWDRATAIAAYTDLLNKQTLEMNDEGN